MNRSKNFVDLMLRENPEIYKFRLSAAKNVNDAYGNLFGVTGTGTTELFEVVAGTTFKSRSIAQRNLYYSQKTNRQTRLFFDLNDYPSLALPKDDEICFLRIEAFSKLTNSYLPKGTIAVIPHPDFYAVPSPILPLTGSAPGVVATAGSLPTDDALRINLPSRARSMTLINHSTVSSIFISFGKGLPYMEIPGGVRPSIHYGSIDELFIVSGVFNTPINFSVSFEILNY